MPNYEIVMKFCSLKSREVKLPATYVSEIRGTQKLVEHINDCLSKDQRCFDLGCRYASGQKDPFNR